MKITRALPLFTLTLCVAACASSGTNSTPPRVPIDTPAPLTTPATADELAALAKSGNAFALDLYAQARVQKGNLVMSPFSISTALAMAWAGAKGETAAQMAKVLHLDGPPDRAVDVAGFLVARYGGPDTKVTVRIANRLFGEKSYAFAPSFVTRLRTAFGAPIEPLDFKSAPEPSREHINAWVAERTQDRIAALVPPGGVTAETRLALVNAIYFLGDWDRPFKKEDTHPAPFFTSKTDKKDVPTMHQTEPLRFAETDGVKLLELFYQDGALAMDVVLPDAVDGLDALEARLDSAALDRWTGAAQTEEVVVSLPKFAIAPPASLSLAESLSAMGMPLAFDRERADFTGVADPEDPAKKLYISAVFHKGFIRVDEKGTEAAAAAAAVFGVGSGAPSPHPKSFAADHPFLYFLRDTRSGLVLFMGRVADPAPTTVSGARR